MSPDPKPACAGVDITVFFPDATGEDTNHMWDLARAYCADCQMRVECLASAVAHNDKDGMFGGQSPRERRTTHRLLLLAQPAGPALCGSPSGYQRHHRLLEPVCDACLEANTRASRYYRLR